MASEYHGAFDNASINQTMDSAHSMIEFPLSDVIHSDIFPTLAPKTYRSQKDVSSCVFHPHLQLLEITHQKGSIWRTMGGCVNKVIYLFPEEALFLFECGKLKIFHSSKELSKPEVWPLLCPNKEIFDKYQVYAKFKRSGYIVMRHGASESAYQNIYYEQIDSLITMEIQTQDSLLPESKKAKFSNNVKLNQIQPTFDIYSAGDYFCKSALLPPDYSVTVVNAKDLLFSVDIISQLASSPSMLLSLVNESTVIVYSIKLITKV